MTFCAVEIRHKELRKLLVNTLCCGDETQRSVEASCEHTSSHQVAHRNDLHNGMNTFLFVQSSEALYQQRLLTPESYKNNARAVQSALRALNMSRAK